MIEGQSKEERVKGKGPAMLLYYSLSSFIFYLSPA
jgi:hypothetical protein